MKAGRFRSDLFYRINVIRINLPPLRERMEDVPLLVRHFVEKYAPDKDIVISDGDPAAASWPTPGPATCVNSRTSSSGAWPSASGNVLHIENVPVEAAGPTAWRSSTARNCEKGRSLKEILADLESRIIRETLAEQQRQPQPRGRSSCGVHRRYLYSKMKQYDIS